MNVAVNVGGVPEHFNYSWHKAIEQGLFLEQGIDIKWMDYPGGTGAMAQSLSAGELDMAIMLTEGAVAAIAQGCPARILHFAVQSPLVWGIHTGFGSSLKKEEDIQGKTFAISRFGSGSHLMAIVQAYLKGWPLDHMKWLEVKNLAGAQKALSEGEADVFLWERYTTKPLVDEGVFRLLGLLPTPWPAFVLVIGNDFMQQHPDVVNRLSDVLIMIQKELKQESSLAKTLALRYQLQEADVLTWLGQTIWSSRAEVSEEEIDAVVESLVKAGILKHKIEASYVLAH